MPPRNDAGFDSILKYLLFVNPHLQHIDADSICVLLIQALSFKISFGADIELLLEAFRKI